MNSTMVIADFIAIILAFIIIFFKCAFAIFLFILVIQAIKYFKDKNKYNCATCIYKQRYMSDNLEQQTIISDEKDGL